MGQNSGSRNVLRNNKVLIERGKFFEGDRCAWRCCLDADFLAGVAGWELAYNNDNLWHFRFRARRSEGLTKAAVEIKMGDPRNKDVTLGPLASVQQYKRVQEYIKSAIEEGAPVTAR